MSRPFPIPRPFRGTMFPRSGVVAAPPAAAPAVEVTPAAAVKAEESKGLRQQHEATPPIYRGFVRILDYGTKPLTGMTAKLHLIDPDDPEIHPFKGMRCARHAGHRLRLVLSQPVQDSDDRTLFVGEASLTWWSDDCQNGMRVTVRLDDGGPDSPQTHPLFGLEPGKNGEVVFLACWAINNEEAPEDPRDARRAARKPFDQLTAVQQSNIKCLRDEQFQRWCAEQLGELLDTTAAAGLPPLDASPAKFAEAVVRAYCGVESRSEFNQDTAVGFAARQKWQEMLRRFEAWRRPRRYTYMYNPDMEQPDQAD